MCAQATVQGALGQLPADAVARAYPVGSPNHDRYTQYGTDALTTAVFEIIISGTLGSLMVRWLSPLLLKPVRLAGYAGSRSPLSCRLFLPHGSQSKETVLFGAQCGCGVLPPAHHLFILTVATPYCRSQKRQHSSAPRAQRLPG